MTSIRKIHVTDGDQELKTLLTAWIKAVERYSALFDHEDNCWWYNERATLSSLAGAAWLLDDWIALEEFSTKKRANPKNDCVESGQLKLGRCDLFISNPDTSFAIEAKQAWQSFGSKADGISYAHKAMKAAWDDSGCLQKDEAGRRFAATFIVPSISCNEVRGDNGSGLSQEKLLSRLETWLAAGGDFIRPGGKETSYAYVFPGIGNESFSIKQRHFPGVVLVLEERFRAV